MSRAGYLGRRAETQAEVPRGDWRVAALAFRTVDGSESSRQVPAFTILSWQARTTGEAEERAREIMNPFSEGYEISMEIWSSKTGRQAEAQPGPAAHERSIPEARSRGPGERRLGDEAEHAASLGGLDLEPGQ